MSDLSSRVQDLVPELRAIRHDLHRHPELGFEEFRTQSVVREHLTQSGYEVRDSGGTGLVADSRPDLLGQAPTIALRADLDCLPMDETTPLPYRSVHPGRAHKCGHDGHTAILLGVAKILALRGRASRYQGNIRFIFQPAEEGVKGGGAKVMVAEGVLDPVHEIYALHNWPGYPLGQLRVCSGVIMAEVCDFDVEIIGRGGHASQPQMCKDPIVGSALLLQSIQTLVSRDRDALEPVVISVCQISGGEARNAIPERVNMSGTMRILNEHAGIRIKARFEEVCRGIALAQGLKINLVLKKGGYPMLVNNLNCVNAVCRAAKEVSTIHHVSHDGLPMAGGEDFAYFARKRPAAYFFLGSGNEEGSTPVCHHPDFDFCDGLLASGVEMFIRIADDRFTELSTVSETRK